MDNAPCYGAKFAPVALHVQAQQLILGDAGAFGALNDEFRVRRDLQRALC